MKKILLITILLASMVCTLPMSSPAMNKAELIEAIASDSGLSKADAKRALDSFINITTEVLKKGDRVALIGFGSFSISKREASIGREGTDECPAVEVVFTHKVCPLDDFTKNMVSGISSAAEITHSEVELFLMSFYSIVQSLHPPRPVPSQAMIANVSQLPEQSQSQNTITNQNQFLYLEGLGLFYTSVEVEDFQIHEGTEKKQTTIIGEKKNRGRNPQTGKEIKIAAKNVVKFKAGADLSKKVN